MSVKSVSLGCRSLFSNLSSRLSWLGSGGVRRSDRDLRIGVANQVRNEQSLLFSFSIQLLACYGKGTRDYNIMSSDCLQALMAVRLRLVVSTSALTGPYICYCNHAGQSFATMCHQHLLQNAISALRGSSHASPYY